MSVEQKPSHPLFVGTYQEVGDRILSSPLDVLLEATLAERNTWGVLILRLMMEQTPITEVQHGETPVGLHIRNALLVDKYCSIFFECAFRIYGDSVWNIIASCVEDVCQHNTYPKVLINRLADILAYQNESTATFTDWSTKQTTRAWLMRLLAAIGLRGKWDRAARVLLSDNNARSYMHAELMKTARHLMSDYHKLFPLEVLVGLANDRNSLPELRAAAFSVLYDNKEDAESCRQLVALSLPSFIEFPGNATALHAVAWRAAHVLPTAAIPLVGRQLCNMNAELFRPQGYCEWRSYNDRVMFRDTAIWQYFYNMPMSLFINMLERKNLSFPEALAALVRLSDRNAHTASGGIFSAAEARALEFVNNPDYLSRLMLMFSSQYVAGRPEWDRIKWAIQHFPAEVIKSCVEIAHRMNSRDRDESYPNSEQIVRVIKTAWEAESKFNKRADFKKQLVEIRNILGLYGNFPEAVLSLTKFIAQCGIRDNKKY